MTSEVRGQKFHNDDSLRASSPFGEPREVTREQHAKGDASVLSQLATLTINGLRHQYEFLRSFLRRHLAGKPVVASRNVDCFLRLQTILFLSLITGGALSLQEHYNWC